MLLQCTVKTKSKMTHIKHLIGQPKTPVRPLCHPLHMWYLSLQYTKIHWMQKSPKCLCCDVSSVHLSKPPHIFTCLLYEQIADCCFDWIHHQASLVHLKTVVLIHLNYLMRSAMTTVSFTFYFDYDDCHSRIVPKQMIKIGKYLCASYS